MPTLTERPNRPATDGIVRGIPNLCPVQKTPDSRRVVKGFCCEAVSLAGSAGRPCARPSESLIMCAHIIESVPNITLTVPSELHRKMKARPEIKWSEVVRRLLAERIRDLERMDALTHRSMLTLEDVRALDRLIKEGLLRRFEAARRLSRA